MSRPEKPIDWNLVDNLLMANCHGTEIAAHFDMHPKTFYAKVEDKFKMTFTEYSLEKKQKGDSILRAKQYEKAVKGDNVMLVWLGKNRLGQKDHHEAPLAPNDKSIDNLISELKQLKDKINAPEQQANPIV